MYRFIAALFCTCLTSPAVAQHVFKPGVTWDWILAEPAVPNIDVAVVDLDHADASAELVRGLKAEEKFVICYVNVGAWEEWRQGAENVPRAIIGNDYDGWPGEKWFDIRALDILRPIMQARFAECRDKGFDAIEPDNIANYAEPTGFPITLEDQLVYSRALADWAHELGLKIGQKNAPETVPDLVGLFDFAVIEDCFAQDECAPYAPYILGDKPVLAAEYTDNNVDLAAMCALGRENKYSFILKRRELDTWVQHCD